MQISLSDDTGLFGTGTFLRGTFSLEFISVVEGQGGMGGKEESSSAI